MKLISRQTAGPELVGGSNAPGNAAMCHCRHTEEENSPPVFTDL